MSGTCSRCGQRGEIEYGVDGQSYCSSCIFYGLNKQCWKCRMYLPIAELQQYKGQWICPNCLMNSRDEDRDSIHARRYRIDERCARCNRETNNYYLWNGQRLCKSCVNDEQKKWGTVGGGPMAGGSRILSPLSVSKEEGFLSRIISNMLIKLGLKKKAPPEIISIQRDKNPFEGAKTMNESKIIEKEETFSADSGQIEGIRKNPILEVQKNEKMNLQVKKKGKRNKKPIAPK